MLQTLLVLLVSSAVALGSVGAASAAPDNVARPAQTSGTKAPQQNLRNATPLPAGGAAGIQQAQGAGGNDWVLIGGGILAGALILVLVSGGGDDDTTSTGTN